MLVVNVVKKGKKMKKIILTLFITMLSFSAYADKINVLKYSRAGGLSDRMSQLIADALGDRFGEIITVKNCVEAKKVFEGSPDPVVTAWSTEYQYGGKKCTLDDKFVLGTFVKSPYHLVYLEGNKVASDVNHLLKGKDVKIGVWDSAFWSAAQSKFFVDLNPNIKVIKYKSKPFRTALPSGEIDYKLVSFPGENPVIAVLGENQYNAKTGEELLPGHVFADMGYSYLVAGNVAFDYTIVFQSDAWLKRTRDITYTPWMLGEAKDKQLDRAYKMLNEVGKASE